MWSFLKQLNDDPKKLFKNIFIHNYCPLAYMKESAKNVTPADMKVILIFFNAWLTKKSSKCVLINVQIDITLESKLIALRFLMFYQ